MASLGLEQLVAAPKQSNIDSVGASLSSLLDDTSFSPDAIVSDSYKSDSIKIGSLVRDTLKTLTTALQNGADTLEDDLTGTGRKVAMLVTDRFDIKVSALDALILDTTSFSDAITNDGTEAAQVYIPPGALGSSTRRRLATGTSNVETAMWVSNVDLHGTGSTEERALAGPVVHFEVSIDGVPQESLDEPIIVAVPIANEETAAQNCIDQPSSLDLFQQVNDSGFTCGGALVCHTWNATLDDWTTEGCETVTLNETTGSVGCRCTRVSTEYMNLWLPLTNDDEYEFGVLDGVEEACTSCQCTTGINVMLQKLETRSEPDFVELKLAENQFGGELLSNWTFAQVISELPGVEGFISDVLPETGDRSVPITLRMVADQLAESASGYSANMSLQVANENGTGATLLNVSVTAAVVARTVASKTVWGEVLGGEGCDAVVPPGDDSGTLTLSFGQQVNLSFSACDFDSLPVEHSLPVVREQLSDSRAFWAELRSLNESDTGATLNQVAVLPVAGGLYALQVLALTPGTFAPVLWLGNDASDAEAATPRIGFNVTISCDAGQVQFEGECVCPAGTEPISVVDGVVTGCTSCPVGTSKPLPGDGECTPCAAGTYQELEGQLTCDYCAPGTSQPLTGSIACVACTVGTFQALEGQPTCSLCEAGTAQNKVGQATCPDCAGGSYQDQRGQTQCLPCETRLNSTAGATKCTLCANSRYHRTEFEASANSCRDCPPRAGCYWRATTLETVVVDYGYWRLSNLSRDLRSCPMEGGVSPCCGGSLILDSNGSGASNCTRASDDALAADPYCREGHKGPLCSVCVDSGQYFKESDALCRDCPSATYFVVLYLGLFFILLLILVVLECHHHTRVARRLRRLGEKMSALELVARLKHWVSFVQVATVVDLTYSVPAPALYKTIFDSFSWAYLDLFSDLFIPSACIGGWRSVALLKGLTPIVLVALFCCRKIVLALRKGIQRGLSHVRTQQDSESSTKTLGGLSELSFERSGAQHKRLNRWITQSNASLLGLLGASFRDADARAFARHHVYTGMLSTLPVGLLAVMFLSPTIGSYAFQAFNCNRFAKDLDVSPPEYGYFLAGSLDIECGSARYYENFPVAIALIAIWPVGSLVYLMYLLLKIRAALLSHRLGALTSASRLLYSDYKREAFWWEWCELFRKHFLLGFVLFIPEQFSFLRIVVGTLFSLSFLTMQMLVRPHKSIQIALTSIGLQVLLVIYLLASTYMKVLDEFDRLLEEPQLVQRVMGFRSIDEIALLCFCVSGGMVIMLLVLVYYQAALDGRTFVLRKKLTQRPPELSLRSNHLFHLFLSHVWSSGQDQMAVMKRSLQRLLPGVRIFLDVDDLQEIGDLERYVDETALVLIFLSKGYFNSRNCLREARAVQSKRKPITLCQEINTSKGGITLADSYQECPEDLRQYVFKLPSGKDRPVIPYHRIREFQLTSLKLIAQEIVKANPEEYTQLRLRPRLQHLPHLNLRSQSKESISEVRDHDSEELGSQSSLASVEMSHIQRTEAQAELYMKGELELNNLYFGHRVDLLVSDHNPGAIEAAQELVDRFPRALSMTVLSHREQLDSYLADFAAAAAAEASNSEASRLGASNVFEASIASPVSLRSKESSEDIQPGSSAARLVEPHFLLYLNEETFVGEDGERLARLVREVRTTPIPITMAHENDDQRGGCDFARFFQTTPGDLIDDGLYNDIALALHGCAHRSVSLALVARAIGAHQLNVHSTSLLGRMYIRSRALLQRSSSNTSRLLVHHTKSSLKR